MGAAYLPVSGAGGGGRGEGIQEKHLRDFTDAAQGSADYGNLS